MLRTEFNKVDVRVQIILLMGAYQIEFLDSVPSYAAINECVELTKSLRRGMQGFVNGVLRSYERRRAKLFLPDREKQPLEYLSVKYSYNIDIVNMWADMYGVERTERLLESGNAVPPLTIRVNTLKTDKIKLAEDLQARGFEVCEADPVVTDGLLQDAASRAADMMLRVGGTGLLDSELYEEGLFSVQDAASVMAVCALQTASGDVVIDVCAAPGGKSMCAAALMNGKGRIISCDIHDHKLDLMRREAMRLGVTIAEIRKNDATLSIDDFYEKADKVIADVPCSGLGVVRRRPEIKLHMNKEKINSLAKLQLLILEKSADYVKEKGILFYSTCTISEIENQAVSEMFLKKNKKFFKAFETQLLPDISNADGFYFCAFQRF